MWVWFEHVMRNPVAGPSILAVTFSLSAAGIIEGLKKAVARRRRHHSGNPYIPPMTCWWHNWVDTGTVSLDKENSCHTRTCATCSEVQAWRGGGSWTPYAEFMRAWRTREAISTKKESSP